MAPRHAAPACATSTVVGGRAGGGAAQPVGDQGQQAGPALHAKAVRVRARCCGSDRQHRLRACEPISDWAHTRAARRRRRAHDGEVGEEVGPAKLVQGLHRRRAIHGHQHLSQRLLGACIAAEHFQGQGEWLGKLLRATRS